MDLHSAIGPMLRDTTATTWAQLLQCKSSRVEGTFPLSLSLHNIVLLYDIARLFCSPRKRNNPQWGRKKGLEGRGGGGGNCYPPSFPSPPPSCQISALASVNWFPWSRQQYPSCWAIIECCHEHLWEVYRHVRNQENVVSLSAVQYRLFQLFWGNLLWSPQVCSTSAGTVLCPKVQIYRLFQLFWGNLLWSPQVCSTSAGTLLCPQTYRLFQLFSATSSAGASWQRWWEYRSVQLWRNFLYIVIWVQKGSSTVPGKSERFSERRCVCSKVLLSQWPVLPSMLSFVHEPKLLRPQASQRFCAAVFLRQSL